MKDILTAQPIAADKADYFDEVKRVYNPIPVFPFLSEADIDAAVSAIIDTDTLAREIQALTAQAQAHHATIADTGYIICLIKWHEYPELIKLLTIVREWAFRNEGGGVGSLDYDEFDLRPETEQLIILDPHYTEAKGCIIGGYRYIIHRAETYAQGPMGAHFQFSDRWKSEQWIELGRSFTNPYLKKHDKRPSIDYVLHGLGYIYARYPESAGYFGKVTLYHIYEEQGADAFFLAAARDYFHPSQDVWVLPSERVAEGTLTTEQKALLDKSIFKGLFYILRNDYQLNLVKIMAVYHRMTPLHKMHYFGAFRHAAFGNTTEMGIAIRYTDIHDVVKDKFVTPYQQA